MAPPVDIIFLIIQHVWQVCCVLRVTIIDGTAKDKWFLSAAQARLIMIPREQSATMEPPQPSQSASALRNILERQIIQQHYMAPMPSLRKERHAYGVGKSFIHLLKDHFSFLHDVLASTNADWGLATQHYQIFTFLHSSSSIKPVGFWSV
jgi:hypothetical protein